MSAQSPSLAVALAGVLALAGCQGSGPEPTSPLFDGPQVVEVTMTEFRYDYDPSIRSGRVVFRIKNAGKLGHSLTMYPLSDDIPPIDEQLRGPDRRGVRSFAETRGMLPGGSASIAVDLAAGTRYAFICFVPDSDGTPHALKGMNSEFRTSGPRRDAPVASSSTAPVVPASPPPSPVPKG